MGWKSIVIAASGPVSSYALASGFAFATVVGYGVPTGDTYFAVRDTQPGFDAHGKLEAGDRIIAVDGRDIYFERDDEPAANLPELVDQSAGRSMEIEVVRDGVSRTFAVRPTRDPELDRYRLGITLGADASRDSSMSIPKALSYALVYPVTTSSDIVSDLASESDGRPLGPLGITVVLTDHLESGPETTLRIIALLIVYLGLLFLILDLVVLGAFAAVRHGRRFRAARSRPRG